MNDFFKMGEAKNTDDKKLHLSSAVLINNDETDLVVTEQLMLNRAIVAKAHREKNLLNALEFTKAIINIKDLPDIILLNIKLFGFDGFAILKEFTKFPKRKTSTCSVVIPGTYFESEPELINQTKKYPIASRHLKKSRDAKEEYN